MQNYSAISSDMGKLSSVAVSVVMILMMDELELCSRITQEETIVRSHLMLHNKTVNLYLVSITWVYVLCIM